MDERDAVLHVMAELAAHARAHDSSRVPVCSPYVSLIAQKGPIPDVWHRADPPAGSGLARASSAIVDVDALAASGIAVVTWTVNDRDAIDALIAAGVRGITSDRPDLLYRAAMDHGFVTPEGLIDAHRFESHGHRGARELRPENTLPAFEAALDALATTLECDVGLTADGVVVLFHDAAVSAATCRRADGHAIEPGSEVLVKDLSLAELQSAFVADVLQPGRAVQRNDLALSPVAETFARRTGMAHPYAIPTLEQLFRFVPFYEEWYRTGGSSKHPDAWRRAVNASRVTIDVESKNNPRPEYAWRTAGPVELARAIASTTAEAGLLARTSVLAFDWRTLLTVHAECPALGTVVLFGDHPVFGDPAIPGSGDGTNLQPDASGKSPWLAGFDWPYRVPAL